MSLSNKLPLTFTLIIITLLSSSCDPEYHYKLSGNVTNAIDNNPLSDLNIYYTFISNSDNNWRINPSDSTIQTDSKGNFNIQESTITFYYDSINISIQKEHFEVVNITKSLDKHNFLIQYDFGNISLNPIQ